MDRSPGMEFIPWAYANAQSILQGALDCAEAAGRGDCAVLKMLYDCLALEVQLCNQIGHPRPGKGNEHYFVGSVQRATGSDSTGSGRADTEKPASLLPATRAGLWAGAHTGEN